MTPVDIANKWMTRQYKLTVHVFIHQQNLASPVIHLSPNADASLFKTKIIKSKTNCTNSWIVLALIGQSFQEQNNTYL